VPGASASKLSLRGDRELERNRILLVIPQARRVSAGRRGRVDQTGNVLETASHRSTVFAGRIGERPQDATRRDSSGRSPGRDRNASTGPGHGRSASRALARNDHGLGISWAIGDDALVHWDDHFRMSQTTPFWVVVCIALSCMPSGPHPGTAHQSASIRRVAPPVPRVPPVFRAARTSRVHPPVRPPLTCVNRSRHETA